MRLPATAKWIGLALLGLVIAGAVAIAASNFTSQQIGIASESITAGDRLAPAVRSAGQKAAANQGQNQPPTTTPTDRPPETTTSTPQTTPTQPPSTTPGQSGEPGDDHGSGGHGADD